MKKQNQLKEWIKNVSTYICKFDALPSQLAFYVNLHRAVIGPSATLTGRWRPDIDLRRMLTGIMSSLRTLRHNIWYPYNCMRVFSTKCIKFANINALFLATFYWASPVFFFFFFVFFFFFCQNYEMKNDTPFSLLRFFFLLFLYIFFCIK